ncbi:MAG: gamma-glutamyl-gamma-aminobutyrate hydrolase family protein, partial [Verrucomicrobiota bacterium]
MFDRAIVVLDYGSQYSQLIVRRIREIGYFSRLYRPEELGDIPTPAAVILSGGPRSTSEEDAPDVDFDYLRSLEVPVLGICYGMQLLNLKWGGSIQPGTTREYGPARLYPCGSNSLLEGVSDSQVWMSHSDTCIPAEGAEVLAKNEEGIPVALRWAPDWYGIQFHPEVSHSEQGKEILANFLQRVEQPPVFEMESFREQLVEQIREEVGSREVICGVSGGVDSSVLAVLLRAAEVRARYLFVNNGLLRKGEVEEVEAQFTEFGIELETIDASEAFLSGLAGVTDPE